jgi:hypothetical protein
VKSILDRSCAAGHTAKSAQLPAGLVFDDALVQGPSVIAGLPSRLRDDHERLHDARPRGGRRASE